MMPTMGQTKYIIRKQGLTPVKSRTASEAYGVIDANDSHALRLVSVPIILMDEGYQRFTQYCEANRQLRHKAKQMRNRMGMLYHQYFNRLQFHGGDKYYDTLDEMDKLQEMIKADLEILRYTILGTLMDIEGDKREQVAELLLINYCTALASGFCSVLNLEPDPEMPRLLRLTRELTLETNSEVAKPTLYINERTEEMITQSINVLLNKFQSYAKASND